MKQEQYSKVYISEKNSIVRGEPSIWIFMDALHELRDWLGKELEGMGSVVWSDKTLTDIQEKNVSSPDIVICDLELMEKNAVVIASLLKEGASNGTLPQLVFIPDKGNNSVSVELVQQDLSTIVKSLVTTRRNIGKVRTESDDNTWTAAEEKLTGNRFLEAINAIITTQIDNPNLAVEEICKEMKMSQSALYRRLKVLTGYSLIPYIRNIRLQKAKALLSETTMTLSEIAFTVGFNDAKFFSKVFFRAYNVRAVDFRKGKFDVEAN